MATTRTENEGTATPTECRIPTFQTIEEAAEFWDTHDGTEFEDEFEDVTDVRFVRGWTKDSIVLQSVEPTLDALAERAFARGIGVSTLVREWIDERPREPAEQSWEVASDLPRLAPPA